MKIATDRLTKKYGRTHALRDVTLKLPPGAIVAVVGLNGAGKSTLLHCLSGIVAPNRGTIRYDGEEFRRSRLDLRMRFGFLPDFPAYLPEQTVLQHIGMTLRLYGKDDAGSEERVLGLLRDFTMLPLADKRMVELSRGQAYKGGLVALMAANPEFSMLDEPFASGMDPLGLKAFRERARAAADAGATILYTTQMLEMAERFSDFVCVLDDGALAAFESTADIRASGMGDSGIETLFAKLAEDQAS